MGKFTRTRAAVAGCSIVVVAVGWLAFSPANPRAAGTPPVTAAMPAASPAASPVPVVSPTVVQVQIEDNTFVPWRLTVPAGTTVFWKNRDARAHTVTAEDGGFDSDRLSYEAGFRHTFTEPGEYGYLCLYHNDMSGTLIVT